MKKRVFPGIWVKSHTEYVTLNAEPVAPLGTIQNAYTHTTTFLSTPKERKLLRTIVRRFLRQASGNDERIQELFQLIYQEARNTYHEDSVPGLRAYLDEQYAKGMDFHRPTID